MNLSLRQRRPTRLAAVLAVAVALASCGLMSPEGVTETVGDYDLSDSDLLAQLGVPEPSVVWQRRIDRLTYVGEGRSPTEAEVLLVATVIDDIPSTLFDKLDVRYVVRASDSSQQRPDHAAAVAFAVGPDVYLLDAVFDLSEGGSTRYDVARAVAHELVHVAQYQTMTDAYIDAALAGEISQVNPVDGSSLVFEFAAATGWSNSAADGAVPVWKLDAGRLASTRYGATGPGEDMAETVALVIIGQADLLPQDRVDWVESWLGAGEDTLALGQPWSPPGSIEVVSLEALYDVDSVTNARGSLSHAEAIYFELPIDAPSVEQLVSSIEAKLRTRVMAGTMERIPDDRVLRFGGLFLRPDGSLLWVELWDFRDKGSGVGGPNAPVLAYVAIW